MRAILWAALLGFSPLARGDDLARYDAKITAEDRAHWAFQPVRRPDVPGSRTPPGAATRSIASSWRGSRRRAGRPSPPPPPLALLRRVHLDLTGLPPTIRGAGRVPPRPLARGARPRRRRPARPPRLRRALGAALARPGAVRRVQRLRARRRPSRSPGAIATTSSARFNDDKPYDRFLLEQLAGDELPDADAETLIATGFLPARPLGRRAGRPEAGPVRPARRHRRDHVARSSSA